MSADEVSHWLEGLSQGEQSAIRQLWQDYFERLVRLARRKLGWPTAGWPTKRMSLAPSIASVGGLRQAASLAWRTAMICGDY